MSSGRDRARIGGIRAGLAGAICLALAGCSATYDNHGYVPTDLDLEQVLPGVDTRDTIVDTIGRPSASGLIRDDSWFYVASRMRNFAYRAPEVVEREIVAVSFDGSGVVQSVERFGLEDGQVVPLSRRVTDSNIRDVTLLSQVIANFGRLNVGQILGGN